MMTDPIRSPLNTMAIRGLSAALDGLSRRQGAIANNIANVDTPYFQATDVDFEGALQAALGQAGGTLPLAVTDPGHLTLNGLPAGAGMDSLAQQVPVRDTATRNDGNNVDLDREMARLAETGIRYNAVSQLLSDKFSLLRTAINEGRK